MRRSFPRQKGRQSSAQPTAAPKSKAGYVYVMDNPSMPGIVKIGMTRRHPQARLRELSSATGVPTPFQLRYYVKARNCLWAEKQVHHNLRKRRVNRNREFFQVTPEEAHKVMKEVIRQPIRKVHHRLPRWARVGAALLLAVVFYVLVSQMPSESLPSFGLVTLFDTSLAPLLISLVKAGLNLKALVVSAVAGLIGYLVLLRL